MWPRIALWVAGFVAVPLAKYIWESILESPSYQKDFEKINADRAAKEKAEQEELERLRKELLHKQSGGRAECLATNEHHGTEDVGLEDG
jgi:hypothetical protein